MGAALPFIAIATTVASTVIGISGAKRQEQAALAQARTNAEISRQNAERNRFVAENNKKIAIANTVRVEAEAEFTKTVSKRRAKAKERELRKRFGRVSASARTRGKSQDLITSIYLEKEAEGILST